MIECMDCTRVLSFEDDRCKQYGLCTRCCRRRLLEIEDKINLWKRAAEQNAARRRAGGSLEGKS